jgi:hypothetical protein
VVARFPKRPYDPRVDFVKFDPPRSVPLSLYGLVQFVVLIAANSHFLALLPKQGTALNVAYFAYILGSLVCLGGVLESRREFLIAEGARLTAIGVAVLATGAWFGGVHDARVLASVVGFQFVSLIWLWLAARVQPKPQAAAVSA